MQITLRVEDQNKLEGLVATGNFASVDEALHAAIASMDRHLDEPLGEDDVEWKQYATDRIEAGLADVEAGRTSTLEEVMARISHLTQKKA